MNQDDRRLLPPSAMLQCFDATVRYGTVSQAASRIGLTQSAVSRQIAQLEGWLGRKLFDRIGRRLVLNAEGRDYHDCIAKPLQDIREATRSFVDPDAARTISLATLPTFGMRWLAPRLPALMMQHPDLIVNIAARSDIFSFENEAFDAAVHVGFADWPGAEHDLLFHERVLPVIAPSLMSGVTQPQDLLRLPLLVQSTRRDAWRQWFEQFEITMAETNAASSFAHVSMLAQAACAGGGIALLPTFAIRQELDAGTLIAPIPVPLPEERAYFLAYPARQQGRPAFRRFRDWLLSMTAAAVAADSL